MTGLRVRSALTQTTAHSGCSRLGRRNPSRNTPGRACFSGLLRICEGVGAFRMEQPAIGEFEQCVMDALRRRAW
jgi:hypothetical protein